MEGAKTPTGTARAEAPGLSAAREKAEAVPVESVAPVAESGDFLGWAVIQKRLKTILNLLEFIYYSLELSESKFQAAFLHVLHQ